jgi:hypothetical protein
MKHRDGIFATLALALGSFALAGMVYTDAYSAAARTEAKGFDALTHEVIGGELVARADDMSMIPVAVQQ